MEENKYTSEIEKLLTGEIEEINVEKEDFFLFRDVWVKHPEKDQIVGEAILGGRVIYRKNS
ncbi:hypothetical protein [Vagococcus hydrophili]|uniref:Uncharacterized protein n=1 Tax=Vagococcus hydrophili TaxID=2714947 RepID=A0A6G8AQP2_9ENTE|nr:hypothetical protein [Vagococcus hydrophili]QIL47384.1 hypothetical protein G7082_01975 [Vagococcus hydrophili]